MVNSVSIGCLNRKEFLAEGSPKSKWTLDVLLKLTEPLWDSGHQRRSAYKADYSNKFLKIVHFPFANCKSRNLHNYVCSHLKESHMA
jgi:hypothetical protein